MSKKFKLDFVNDETGEEFSVYGELSDDEVRLLERFAKYTDEVLATSFIRKGDLGDSTLNFRPREGTVSEEVVLPNWDDVTVFLHRFRPILLEREPTSFKNVLGLLGRHLPHASFRNALKLQRNLFSGKAFQGLVQFKVNGVLLNSDKMLFDWLNAHEFHRDDAKAAAIEDLHQMFSLDVSKTIFLRQLFDKAKACCNIAQLIDVLLGKQEEVVVESIKTK